MEKHTHMNQCRPPCTRPASATWETMDWSDLPPRLANLRGKLSVTLKVRRLPFKETAMVEFGLYVLVALCYAALALIHFNL
jgi:hypothetical protein